MANTVPDVLEIVAGVVGEIDGVRSSFYPAPHKLQETTCPAFVLYWGGPDATEISHESVRGGTLWIVRALGQLLVPMKGNTPAEFAAVDSYIEPIVDAFAKPVIEIGTLAGLVHRCHIQRVRSMLSVDYAGLQYAAAEFDFEIKMHRRNKES